ncbi:hypothetical protein [Teichococcus oryzae]|uniref:Uncharacterized protein n=1 Tax=Teichococcus oryzae TaxID=1608942 RepID=A0A5B2TFE3_9PROT|nr:hypothetical protein [Pseudoroseomonas oryzae]KAA2212823.1 hypothetical protein F0Q34_11850 [Pseudoroseomonas oryzae]
MLEAYGRQRDELLEAIFRDVYAAPVVQSFTGLATETMPPRQRPGGGLEDARLVALAVERLHAAMKQGGLHETVLRALLWVRLPTANADERSFAFIRGERGQERIPFAEFERILRQQF